MSISAHGDILTEKEAAAYLSLSPRTLQQWRYDQYHKRPHHMYFGGSIRYSKRELDNWIEARRSEGREMLQHSNG